MAPVGKEDMVRFVVDLFPRNSLSLLLKLSDFFLFRTFCDRFFMAFQASVDFRDSGKGLGFVEVMASVAS
jgi:hypothetical protein